MFKKILIGSGLAFSLFLATIFLFGDQNIITWVSPKFSVAQNAASATHIKLFEKNLTDTISANLASQLLKDNPEGPQKNSDGTLTARVANPSIFLSQALVAEQNQFNPEDFIEPPQESNITVLPSDSQEARNSYIQGLKTIITSTFKTAVSKTSDDKKAVFEKLSEERNEALKKMYGLKVTPDLKELHLDILTVVGTQRNIFSALADYEADPLKALLAIQFESDVKANLQDIIKRMSDFIQLHKLTS